MIQWMRRITRNDKIRNEHIRRTRRMAQASKKLKERRSNWYGHVMRRDGEHILRKELGMVIPGKRKMTTENKMKRRVPARYENYWNESGRDGVGRSSGIPTIIIIHCMMGKRSRS